MSTKLMEQQTTHLAFNEVHLPSSRPKQPRLNLSFNNEYVPIKTYSRSQLAAMYGVTLETISAWMRLFDIENSGGKFRNTLPPNMVTQIFEAMGQPLNTLEECL